MTRQLQGVTPIDGIAEEMGFDMDEIYQVLGRDILKSSLLDDIDLYLECDDDSLYVMPTVVNPARAPDLSCEKISTDEDSKFVNSPSDEQELFDIELDEETDFSCVDPDVAFPVSTFVNCANAEHPSLRENSLLPSVDHNYVARSPVDKATWEHKVQLGKDVGGKEGTEEEIQTNADSCVENMAISDHAVTRPVESTINHTSQIISYLESQSNADYSIPDQAVETEKEATDSRIEIADHTENAKNLNEIKITFSIPRYPLIEDDVRYSCAKCKYTCTREILLKDHRAKQHGEKDLFKCANCHYVGQLFKHLQKHMLRQHQVRLSSVEPGEQKLQTASKNCNIFNVSITEPFEEPKGNSKCGNTQNQLETVKNTDITSKVTSENQPSFVGDKIKVQDINLRQKLLHHFLKLNGHRTVPPKWSGTLKLVSLLKASVICDKMSDGSKLHASPKQHHCDICEKTFKQTRTFVAHQNAHRGSFPHQCDVCGKSFSCKNLLNQHQKTHSTEKRHHCTASGCTKSFRTNNRLRDHMNTVHSECKPFTCERCGRSYAREKDLRAHHNSHTEIHKCTWGDCAKTFRDTFNLKQHYMTHTGDKPLECTHCQYKCVQKHALDSHIKHHH